MNLRVSTATAMIAALMLTGCGGGKPKDVDALDRELVGNSAGDQTDPALTSALEDQIMVDPTLAQQKDGAATPPGAAPVQAPVPATGADRAAGSSTLGELAQSQAAGKAAAAKGACYKSLQYSQSWAQRLPAELPLFPDAQVSEAAGAASPGCNVRIVSFVSGAAIDKVADFYEGRAKRAGYAAERQGSDAERVVGGEKGEAAFYATLRTAQGGGTQVDLVVNHGR